MLKILHIGKPGNVARFAGGLRLPEHTLAECRSGSSTADYLAAGGDADVSDRLLLSPHIGGVTNASLHRAHRIFWRAVEALSAGAAPENIVNIWD